MWNIFLVDNDACQNDVVRDLISRCPSIEHVSVIFVGNDQRALDIRTDVAVRAGVATERVQSNKVPPLRDAADDDLIQAVAGQLARLNARTGQFVLTLVAVDGGLIKRAKRLYPQIKTTPNQYTKTTHHTSPSPTRREKSLSPLLPRTSWTFRLMHQLLVT